MPSTDDQADEWGTDQADEVGAIDELTTRRVVNNVLAQYRELVSDPERLACVDRNIEAVDIQIRALDQGRAAYARGDFDVAEQELILAYNRHYGDSSVYLTALYRRTNELAMAEGWWTIAQAEGFSQDDLEAVLDD